jgi:hypothetical protein
MNEKENVWLKSWQTASPPKSVTAITSAAIVH